jgi:hypothetical protein
MRRINQGSENTLLFRLTRCQQNKYTSQLRKKIPVHDARGGRVEILLEDGKGVLGPHHVTQLITGIPELATAAAATSSITATAAITTAAAAIAPTAAVSAGSPAAAAVSAATSTAVTSVPAATTSAIAAGPPASATATKDTKN